MAPLPIFTLDSMAVFDVLCYAPSRCRYKLESPPDKLCPSLHEGVTPCRPAVRLWVHREGLEGGRDVSGVQ